MLKWLVPIFGQMFRTSGTNEFPLVISVSLKSKYKSRCMKGSKKNSTSIFKRKEIINNGNITDNWNLVHYLVIHVHCVGSWYLKDR
jgi:hypothetical protein